MAITKARKDELVAQYIDLLERTNGFVIVETKGMTVKETQELRRKIREADGAYAITKNTLFAIALKEKDWPVPEDLLKGPTAVAFGLDNMPGVSKAVLEYVKDLEAKIQVKGGVMTGDILNPKQVDAVSKLPTLDELRSQLAGLIVQPASGLAGVLQAANSQIVNVIQALLDKENEGSEGGEAA